MTKKKITFPVVCNQELKDTFMKVCRANDTNGARVLRAAMREYIEQNAQTKLL